MAASSNPDDQPPSVLGVVLCGGRSSRMGRDKALIGPPSMPLAARVAAAQRGAGVDDVVLVGGDGAALGSFGRWLPDDLPDAGPLGGIATAATANPGARLMVCSCDLPWLEASALRPLLDAVEAGAQAAAFAGPDGIVQWSILSLGATAAHAAATSFAQGERSVRGTFESIVEVLPSRDPRAISDVDTPEDLPDELRRGEDGRRSG